MKAPNAAPAVIGALSGALSAVRNRISRLGRVHLRLHVLTLLRKWGGGLVAYALLLLVGFVYLYPLLRMVSLSFMDSRDIVDPNVGLLPTRLTFVNYEQALQTLNMPTSVLNSAWLSFLLAAFQTLSSAMAGYAFARYRFRGRSLLLFLVLATYLVPMQVLTIPRFMVFSFYKLVGSMLPLLAVALFGQGLSGPIFIMIFHNFFRMLPRSIDEAAQIDGASQAQVFLRITLAMSIPILTVSFLFSFVWNWNETYVTGLVGAGKFSTLPLELEGFVASYNRLYARPGTTSSMINEAIRMAGTLVAVLPLLLLYAVLQRQFVEGIEKTGITGE